jgi:large subunit ribosomal protein L3
MVKGAVPGAKGGWIMVRDAVKKPQAENAIPGDVPTARLRSARRAGEAAHGKPKAQVEEAA